jgi:hypothetical protein
MYEIHQQRTVLVIPVFEAIPCIQPFRAEHIPTPAAALPPHVTIRGPFVPFEAIDDDLHNVLIEFFSSQSQFRFTLQTIGRFVEADVLYLIPEPELPFQALMRAVNSEFPDAPQDFFPHRRMHVTIARCGVEGMDELERAFYRECGGSLPIEAVAREVWLYEKYNGTWHKRCGFDLGVSL